MNLPVWWQPHVEEFINRVNWLSQWAGFTVSSFGRTVSHNQSVGGVSHSQHLLWTAADLVPVYPDDMDSLEQTAKATQAFGFVLNEGDHVHVQLYEAGQIPDWVWSAVPIAA